MLSRGHQLADPSVFGFSGRARGARGVSAQPEAGMIGTRRWWCPTRSSRPPGLTPTRGGRSLYANSDALSRAARAPALTAISPGTNLLGRSRTAATRADGTGILLWPQPAFSGRASCPLVALGPTVTRPRLARKDCLTGPRLVLAAQLGTCYCTVAHAHTPNRTQRGRRGGGGLRNPLATSPSHSFFFLPVHSSRLATATRTVSFSHSAATSNNTQLFSSK
jgi:hypothetical protein